MTVDPAKLRASALGFFLPSVRDLIFIFLLGSLLVGKLSNRPLADPDIGWHIRTGEQILRTHALPHTDSYSSTMHGQPWYAWEWLYDGVLGLLHRACGLNGVVWLCAVIVATTFAFLLSLLLRRGTGLLLAIPLLLLSEAAATIHLFARPHIVSWLFVLAWFAALERWEQGSAARWLPWFFPTSMLLWVNLHGEWVFGLMLMAMYFIASVIDSLRVQDPFAAVKIAQRARTLAWSWAASAAVTLVNPFGWRLHSHIYQYLGDRYLMNRIAEFKSPDFHGAAQRCFGLILMLTLVAFAGRSQRVKLCHLLVALLAVYTGLLSSRNLPVSSMLLVLIIGPLLWESLAALASAAGAWSWLRSSIAGIVEFSERMVAQELRLTGHLWPLAGAVATLAICLNGGFLGSRRVIHAEFNPGAVPVSAVEFLGREPRTDPIFSIDSWGGYIIYRLYPQRLVVLDDRHDLYGSDRMREFLILMQGEPGWRAELDKLNFHTALLPDGSTLANLLRELPQDWQVTYEDNVAVVFERR